MQKSDQRLVLFFDIKVETYVSLGPNGRLAGLRTLPIGQLFQLVDKMRANGLLSRPNRSRSELLYLADLVPDPAGNYLTLLINRSDKDASDYVLTNPQKSQRRVIQKRTGEGADFSAHLMIKLKASKPDTYEAALEVSPGLPSPKITSFLNHLLRMCDLAYPTEFHRPHPDGSTDKDGNPRLVKARHKVELRGHPSDSFLRDLNSGELEGIELVDGRHKNHAWDSNGYIVERSREIHLKPKAKQFPGRIYDAVKSVSDEARKKHYEVMRVRFKTNTGVPRTVELETDTAQVANDDRYIKKETVRNFSSPLPTSFDTVSSEICDRIRVLLR